MLHNIKMMVIARNVIEMTAPIYHSTAEFLLFAADMRSIVCD
ncbi:Hypothetical protein ETEE_3512 [Edwardsiella anguillarum ET080813]|uniref:Uncharacterized protein n=1 Tax=Edwardsiella anguillarum ET080813 TaxID=667120 RepID=A0A076LTY1_9GAMM|nr:Hypothetical protein ETEE_3512 [Edwardsiella anguillarum ET080813]